MSTHSSSGQWLCIRSSRVVLEGNSPVPAAILVDREKGKIAQVVVGDDLVQGKLFEDFGSDVEVKDYGDLVIMPGLVDSHVHVNDPGRTDWERFDTATQAAVAGGTTTIGDMPLNCIPVTTDPEAVNSKLEATRGRIWTDLSLLGGLVPQNASPEAMKKLCDSGVSCVKGFLCNSGNELFDQIEMSHIESCIGILKDRAIPLMVHAEVELDNYQPCCSTTKNDSTCNSQEFSSYLKLRPASMEVEAIRRMIDICRRLDTHVHIVHLSAADALPLIESAREEGLKLTVETCPHYLVFCSEDIPDGATWFKCCPPIRSLENQEKLWKGLESGLIDMIVSDHSPSSPDLKCLATVSQCYCS